MGDRTASGGVGRAMGTGRTATMETTGTPTFHLAVSPQDLPGVARALAQPGPFTTVFLTTDPEIENAAQRSDVRWKEVRRSLVDAAAAASDFDAIGGLVGAAHLEGRRQAAC